MLNEIYTYSFVTATQIKSIDTLISLMSAKRDTGSPFVIVACILARYLLRSIDLNGINFFGFYKFTSDYDQNFAEKKKKKTACIC